MDLLNEWIDSGTVVPGFLWVVSPRSIPSIVSVIDTKWVWAKQQPSPSCESHFVSANTELNGGHGNRLTDRLPSCIGVSSGPWALGSFSVS